MMRSPGEQPASTPGPWGPTCNLGQGPRSKVGGGLWVSQGAQHTAPSSPSSPSHSWCAEHHRNQGRKSCWGTKPPLAL